MILYISKYKYFILTREFYFMISSDDFETPEVSVTDNNNEESTEYKE